MLTLIKICFAIHFNGIKKMLFWSNEENFNHPMTVFALDENPGVFPLKNPGYSVNADKLINSKPVGKYRYLFRALHSRGEYTLWKKNQINSGGKSNSQLGELGLAPFQILGEGGGRNSYTWPWLSSRGNSFGFGGLSFWLLDYSFAPWSQTL